MALNAILITKPKRTKLLHILRELTGTKDTHTPTAEVCFKYRKSVQTFISFPMRLI